MPHHNNLPLDELALPFTLSADARRALITASGAAFEYNDVWERIRIEALTESDRERLVDITARVAIERQLPDMTYLWEVTSYEYLHRTFGTDDFSVVPDEVVLGIDDVWFPSPATTLDLREEAVRTSACVPVLAAALAGRPMIQAFDADTLDAMRSDQFIGLAWRTTHLGPAVLDAYEKALDEIGRVIELALAADYTVYTQEWLGLEPMGVSDDFVFVRGTDGSGNEGTTAFVRESDPEAFSRAHAIFTDLASSVDMPGAEFRNRLARRPPNRYPALERPTDAEVVRTMVEPTYQWLVEERTKLASAVADREAFVKERDQWIASHGSSRLQRAAERGYKHDAIYRDERLGQEMPGFVTVSREVTVREIINPSAAALDHEDRLTSQYPDADLKLVYVVAPIDDELPDGEYLQLSGFLGRYTAYSPVEDLAPRGDD